MDVRDPRLVSSGGGRLVTGVLLVSPAVIAGRSHARRTAGRASAPVTTGTQPWPDETLDCTACPTRLRQPVEERG